VRSAGYRSENYGVLYKGREKKKKEKKRFVSRLPGADEGKKENESPAWCFARPELFAREGGGRVKRKEKAFCEVAILSRLLGFKLKKGKGKGTGHCPVAADRPVTSEPSIFGPRGKRRGGEEE